MNRLQHIREQMKAVPFDPEAIMPREYICFHCGNLPKTLVPIFPETNKYHKKHVALRNQGLKMKYTVENCPHWTKYRNTGICQCYKPIPMEAER